MKTTLQSVSAFIFLGVGLHEPQLVLVGHLEVEREAASFLQRELRSVLPLPPNQPYIIIIIILQTTHLT